MNRKTQKSAIKGIKKNRREKASKKKVARRRVLKKQRDKEEFIKRKRKELKFSLPEAIDCHQLPQTNRGKIKLMEDSLPRADYNKKNLLLEQINDKENYSSRGEEQLQLYRKGISGLAGKLGRQGFSLCEQQLSGKDYERLSIDNND